jgi:hypothetical protein
MLPRPRRLLRPLNHSARNATHRRAMHAETPVRDTLLQLIQERDPPLPLVDVDAHPPVRHVRVGGEFLGEGVVMRREEADAADVARDVMQDGLRDGDAIVGRRAAAELVEDDERARGGFGEDLFGFGELDEEGGLGGEDVVVCAEAGHDAVAGGEAGGAGGDVAADLGEDDGDAGLRGGEVLVERKGTEKSEGWGLYHAENGGFPGCVGAGEEVDVRGVAAEFDVVGDEVGDIG